MEHSPLHQLQNPFRLSSQDTKRYGLAERAAKSKEQTLVLLPQTPGLHRSTAQIFQKQVIKEGSLDHVGPLLMN